MPARSRLRVALISYNFGEYCARLASALASHADVLLLLPTAVVEPHTAKLHDSVHLFAFPNPRLRQPIQQIKTIRALSERIREFSPDVIHYQGGHFWFDLALPTLRRYPLVLTIHDFKPHPGDQLSQKTPIAVEMFARRLAQELIVHTYFTRELVLREFSSMAESVSVIPHIQIGRDLSSTAVPEDPNLILFFGRIWEYKGLEYLIRAEPFITARVPEARILIAGQGEDFSRYTRMMCRPERFLVHNEFIPEELAVVYFERASVVVLPYIEASQSGVIPMAYSAGKPVVATRVGGLPEMVEDGHTGYLVAPRDSEKLAEAMARLLLDPPLRRQMGANGKRKIETECGPELVAQQTIGVYRRAIERFHRGRTRALVGNFSPAPPGWEETPANTNQKEQPGVGHCA
jgi:glycosyltransferase involved in cell wall biosynthesis